MKPRKYKLSCPSVYIDTTEISYVDTAKYLGVIISHDLSDDTDMKRQLVVKIYPPIDPIVAPLILITFISVTFIYPRA